MIHSSYQRQRIDTGAAPKKTDTRDIIAENDMVT